MKKKNILPLEMGDATSAMSDNFACSDDSDWMEVAYYLSLHIWTSRRKHVCMHDSRKVKSDSSQCCYDNRLKKKKKLRALFTWFFVFVSLDVNM